MIDHKLIILSMPYVALVGANVVAHVFLEAWLGPLHQKRVTSLSVRVDQLIKRINSIGSTVVVLLYGRVEGL